MMESTSNTLFNFKMECSLWFQYIYIHVFISFIIQIQDSLH